MTSLKNIIIKVTDNWSVTNKLILAITLSSLLSLALLVMAVSISMTREIETQISSTLTTRAQLEGESIGILLAEQIDLIRAVTESNPELIEVLRARNAAYTGSDEAIEAQLLELDAMWLAGDDAGNELIARTLNNPIAYGLGLFVQQFPAHAEIFITDIYGGEIAGSGQTSDYYQADEDWWQAGWNDGQGAVSFGTPEFDASANIIAIEITVPIFDPTTSTTIGIVKSVYDITALINGVETFTLGRTGSAQLIDSSGHFITAETVEGVGLTASENIILGERIFSGSGYELNALNDSGESVVVGYAPVIANESRPEIESLLWVVRVEQSHDEAFSSIAQLQYAVLGITIIVAAFSIIIAFTLGRLLTGELRTLTTVATQFGEGDLQARSESTSQDEVGILARTFNEMADSVEQRQNVLNEFNQTLEQRVAERTIELNEARREAQESARMATENSRLKSEFLSMMSHELRTPMNAIQGFTGIILSRMAGVEFNEKTERYLTKIQSNSRRLLGLINDFLDLSRIESGRLELVYSPISPADMAQQWQDNLSSLAEDKELELLVTVDPDLPAKIYGDEESLSKIAINLLGNAIKFTETGSVTLNLEKQDDRMALEVRDTGIGIPPHAREFVFEEFRQVDQSSTRKYSGTGLGLAIVQKLVREMDGQITLNSEVGVGSVFTVLLPIHTEPQSA